MSAKLFLYGQFRWELSSGEVVPPLRDKTQALIAHIALSGNGAVNRKYAANLLWGGGRDPGASLRQSIREIRIMEEEYDSHLFSFDKNHLQLDLNELWVDARLATTCSHTFKVGFADQILACELGPFLEDCTVEEEFFDDWLLLERSRRESDLNLVLEQYLEMVHGEKSKIAVQKRIASALLNLDPTNELAYRTLINASALEGDRASALRHYATCRDILEKEVGEEPSQETTELIEGFKSNGRVQKKAFSVDTFSAPIGQALETHAKPIIQISPFTNSPNGDVLDYFARNFQSDICEQISRNRRFTVRDMGIPIFDEYQSDSSKSEIAEMPDYIVRGNVLAISDNLTFLVQLYEAKNGNILWMKRLVSDTTDAVSHLSEAAVLSAVDMVRFVELHEAEKVNGIEDGLLNARQCVIRAVSSMFKFSANAVANAERYLQRALLLLPHYPEALAWLAFLKSIEIGQGYTEDVPVARDEIGMLVRRSIELAPNDDVILAIAGHLEAFIHHDFESAIEYFDRALQANPNCAYAWGFNAITNCYIGEPEEALEMLKRCRQIMPFDPHPYYFDTARCIASMLAGKYEDAVRIGRQVLRNNPNFHANYRPLISSLGHLERPEEASPVVLEFEKHQPDFSVSWHLANYPPLDEEKTETYVKGLRKAGVSE